MPKVAEETLQEWEDQGNGITLVTRYLGLNESVIHAVLEELGLSEDDHVASIAYILDAEWEELLTTLTVDGGPLKVGVKAKLRRLLAISRTVCTQPVAEGEGQGEAEEVEHDARLPQSDPPGGQTGVTEDKTIITVSEQPDDAPPKPTTMRPSPATPTLEEIANKKSKIQPTTSTGYDTRGLQTVTVLDDLTTVKLSEVVLQGCDIKVPLIDLQLMRDAKNRFKQKEGDKPLKEESPTREQATGFLALLKVRESIFLDFAVFGPHGGRLLKQRRFDAMVYGPDGILKKIEMMGPSNYREWEAIYKVFRTLCIGHDVIDNAWLDRYNQKVRVYNDENPEGWGIIYQADYRARLEHAPDVREELEDKYAEDIVYGRPTTFDPARPWNAVWRQLCLHEDKWWNKAIEKPCLLIMAGTARPCDFIDGDALTRRPSGKRGRGEEASDDDSPPRKRRRNRGGNQIPYVPKPPGAEQRQYQANGVGDLSVWDGAKYIKNRAGSDICKGYQTGHCCRIDSYNKCAHDGRSAHQCEVCLMVGHGSSEQGKCPKQRGTKPTGRGGKGGGRGRARGGRGGKGGRNGK